MPPRAKTLRGQKPRPSPLTFLSHVVQGGLEALPMIQRVKVRASFQRCKQNVVIIQGHSQVFTWLLLRFGSLL